MTSQGPYQDDLVRRMMIADERPLRDAMKADASSEDENVIGAAHHGDEASNLTQDIDNGNPEHRHEKNSGEETPIIAAHHNDAASILTPDINNGNTELPEEKIVAGLDAEIDLVVAAPTAPNANPNAEHEDSLYQTMPTTPENLSGLVTPHPTHLNPYQTIPTTPEHLLGSVTPHTTHLSPRVVSRSTPRRVSRASSSDADDEEEIPVSLEPEAARLLPQNLQENLHKIVSESQQKVEERAQRSARVASGNSFSQHNAANSAISNTQGIQAHSAQRGSGQEHLENNYQDAHSARQSTTTMDRYEEIGTKRLSYANITNPDPNPPSSSDDDMKRRLLGRKDRGKGDKDTSAPLQAETNTSGTANTIQDHFHSNSFSSVGLNRSFNIGHGQAESASSNSGQVIQGSMGVARPNVQTYSDMMQNERNRRERMAAIGTNPRPDLGRLATLARRLRRDAAQLMSRTAGEAVGFSETGDFSHGSSMRERIDQLEIELHEFIGMPGPMTSTAGMSMEQRMKRLEMGLANSQEPVPPNADRKEMLIRIQGQEARMRRLRGEAALSSHATTEEERALARQLREQLAKDEAENREAEKYKGPEKYIASEKHQGAEEYIASEKDQTPQKYEGYREVHSQEQVNDAAVTSKDNGLKSTLQAVREQAKKGLSPFFRSPRSPPVSAVRGERVSGSDRSFPSVLSRAAKIEGPKKSLKDVLERINRPVKVQRVRSPLYALTEADLHPPPKRGPMYSTMESGSSLGGPFRNNCDDQRWHQSYKDLHGGDRSRISRHHDDSGDTDNSSDCDEEAVRLTMANMTRRMRPQDVGTPVRGSDKIHIRRFQDSIDDAETPVIGSGLHRMPGSQERTERTGRNGVSALGSPMGRAPVFDNSLEDLDAHGINRADLTPTRRFPMPGRPYNRSPEGVSARAHARTSYYPAVGNVAIGGTMTAPIQHFNQSTGEEFSPDEIGMPVSSNSSVSGHSESVEDSSAANDTTEENSTGYDAVVYGTMTARGRLEDY